MANPYNVDIRGGTKTYSKNSDPYNSWGADNATTFKPAVQQVDKTAQQTAAKSKTVPKTPPPSLFNRVKSFVGDNAVKPIENSGKAIGDTVVQKAESMTGHDKAAATSQKAASTAYDQSFTKGVADKYVQLKNKAGQQIKHLSQPAATPEQRQTLLSNVKHSGKVSGYSDLLKSYGGNVSAEAQNQSDKMASSGTKLADIKAYLDKQHQAYNANTKKGAATAVGIAADVAGGGELGSTVKTAANLAKKDVEKSVSHKVIDTALETNTMGVLGGVSNASSTVAANPDATGKDISKSFEQGYGGGVVLHGASKAAGKAIGKSRDTLATKFTTAKVDKVGRTNLKTNSLLSPNRQPTEVHEQSTIQRDDGSVVPSDSKVKTTYNPSNPQVKTLLEARQKQTEAIEAPVKAAEAEQKANIAEAEKTQEQSKKVDRQIELIKAKGKDSDTGLSNVDKTKLTHLQEDKQQLQTEPATNGTVADVKPPQQSPATVEAPQTPAPTAVSEKPVSASSGNSTPKISNRKQTEYKPGMPEPTHVPVPEPKPLDSPEIKTSKLAQRGEAIAIKKGLADVFHDKPEYAKVNEIKQSNAAADLLKSDPKRVIRIAMGHEKPPEGLLPETAWVAAVKHAQKTKDGKLLHELSTQSHLVSEATGMGQRIQALSQLEANNPAAHIKQISKAGNDAFEKKTGKSFDKVVRENIKAAKKEVTPANAKTFSSFVESLKC